MPPNVVPRSDLTRMLGQNLLEGPALAISREYGLKARPGARSYVSLEHGIEVTVDDQERVAWVMLHFHGDYGFRPYRGAIPGRGGSIARRSSLWAALGRPTCSNDPNRTQHEGATDEWAFPWFVMHAQYGPDGETLLRLVLARQ